MQIVTTLLLLRAPLLDAGVRASRSVHHTDHDEGHDGVNGTVGGARKGAEFHVAVTGTPEGDGSER